MSSLVQLCSVGPGYNVTQETSSLTSRREILEVRNLSIAIQNGPPIVNGIDLTIRKGEILCLVGESGAGKSFTALALMRLLPRGAMVSADTVRLEQVNILEASAIDMERLRGDRLAIIFQDSALSLNPLMSIGDQIVEALQVHRPMSQSQARVTVMDMLNRVRLPGGDERFRLFPHQMSGGMRQRALVAMALICRPALLIADEPTSSLDALVQRQIVALIDELRSEFGAAVLLITHNLGLVEDVADEISVMFAGQIVERGSRRDIFDNSMHPYTLALLSAHEIDAAASNWRSSDASAPSNDIPLADGCRFAPRCPVALDLCRSRRPTLIDINVTHSVACWRVPLEDNVV